MYKLKFTVSRRGQIDKTITFRRYYVDERNQEWVAIATRIHDNGLARISNTMIELAYPYMRKAVSL